MIAFSSIGISLRNLQLREGVKSREINSCELVVAKIQTSDILISFFKCIGDKFGNLISSHQNVANIGLGS